MLEAVWRQHGIVNAAKQILVVVLKTVVHP
jgi:hypothetical protein